MRKILVMDCSGSMHGGPMDQIIDHVERSYPPDMPWITVTRDQLHRGTVRDIDRLRHLPGGGPEIMNAARFALAPGMLPVLVTDDCDDLNPVLDMATGHGMDLVILRVNAGNRPHGPYEQRGLGTVTYI